MVKFTNEMKSTQAMRDRIRELSTPSDDYDRAVVCVVDDLERLLNAMPERGNYENRHPDDMILWSASDHKDLIEVVEVLGIQDSHQTPAEAVRELHAEIERLHSLIPDVPQREQDMAAALRLLMAEDERQSKLHELLETIREQIRTGVEPEHRPDGLFKNIQDAVYAMRGRTRLMDDVAITHIFDEPQEAQVPEDPEMCWHTSTEAEGELVVTQYELAAAQTALREIAGMSHNCRSVDIAKAALAVTRPEPQTVPILAEPLTTLVLDPMNPTAGDPKL